MGATMTYIGTIKNGKVELPRECDLPEGTRVRVEPVGEQAEPMGRSAEDAVYRLHELAVDCELPPDLASQHDHYIYGIPKRPRGSE